MRVLEPLSNVGSRGMTFTDVAATRRRDKTRLIGHSGTHLRVAPDLQEEAFGSSLKRFDGQSETTRAGKTAARKRKPHAATSDHALHAHERQTKTRGSVTSRARENRPQSSREPRRSGIEAQAFHARSAIRVIALPFRFGHLIMSDDREAVCFKETDHPIRRRAAEEIGRLF